VDGFLYVIDPLETGSYPEENLDHYFPLLSLEDKIGETDAVHALNQASKNNPALRKFLRVLYIERRQEVIERRAYRRPSENNRTSPSVMSYAEVKRMMEESRKHKTGMPNLRGWGEHASEADFLTAAQDFMTLEEPREVLTYLGMF